MEKLETVPFRKRAAKHFKRYKVRYLTGGICLTIGGIVGVFVSKYKKPIPTNIDDGISHSIGIIDYLGRNGHPGNVIYCNETKQVFKSHREASRELGIDNRDLWAYLKGIRPTAKGYTFKKVGEAQKLLM